MKRVALIGLGAIGAYFYWGLQSKQDVELIVIADGDRADRLKNVGITINDVRYDVNVRTAGEASAEAPVDLVLVATKYGALRSVLPDIRTLTSEKTIVLSLLNGIDSEDILAEVIPEERILHSLMMISSRRCGQTVTFDPVLTEGVYYGDKNSRVPTEKTEFVDRILDGSDVKHTYVSDIIAKQWEKFVINCGGNLPQAVFGVGTGAYGDSEHVNFISEMLWEEARAIAAAKGISIREYPFRENRRNVPDATRWSTLQDLDDGRHTEIDMFSGAVMRMGEELGIPVPYHTYTYHAIKALEEKNDGKFNY
ncbi:MAG: 2-dehydropantoate 2-reductase [Candidatus Choladocola sp.]|nr:2-dehydropantoate 2-reductase [Candidatus Choladocola sp.]